METAKIEFATSRRPILIDAKRALYQLSYVPLIVIYLLNLHGLPGETQPLYVRRIIMLQRHDTCFYSLKYSA